MKAVFGTQHVTSSGSTCQLPGKFMKGVVGTYVRYPVGIQSDGDLRANRGRYMLMVPGEFPKKM